MQNYGSTDRIFALLPDVNTAQRVIDQLRNLGVRDQDMAVALPQGQNTQEVGGGVHQIGQQGFLSNLFGTGTDVYRGLKDMGFSDQDARNYADQVNNQGNVLLSVRCGNDCGRLQSVLGNLQAFTPSGNVNWSDYGYGTGTATGTGTAESNLGTNAPERSIPIREERLQAERQSRQAGEVDVTKDVVQEQQSMNVPVSHEEVDVQYRDVPDRPAQEGLNKEDIRVPVSEEQVDVNKETVETGEIDVNKRKVTEQQQVSGEVRKEVPHVEKKGNVRGENVNNEDITDEAARDENLSDEELRRRQAGE